MTLTFEIKNILDGLRQYLEIEKYSGVDSFILKKDDMKDKNKLILALIEEAKQCKECSLYKTRKRIVLGEGNLSAEILFLGEAPGQEEDLEGRPFVGRAGKLLTQIIEAVGYKREEVYITNVLKCRPPFNRPPKPEEIDACFGFLKKQIEAVKPKVICALGRFANYALLRRDEPLSRLRGKIYLYEGIKVVPTFHPAYLLRNPSEKKAAWQDFKKALQIIKRQS